jgi:TolA-binding protein
MKRWSLLFIGVAFAVNGGWCQESPATPAAAPAKDTPHYLKELQVKLEHAAKRANQPTATGSNVIGVRGSKQEPLSKQLYWKGKAAPPAVTPDEVKVFRSAVEQAQAGRTDEAVTALNAFIQQYPNSSLLPDAKEALARLSQAPPTPAASTGTATQP